jgi:hypothetical protein
MNMDLQEQTNWCWAAVASAIHNFLSPADARTQGQIATPVLVQERQIPTGVDCTENPGLCNFRAALDDALNETGDLKRNGFKPDHFLTYSAIRNWMDAGLPVGARIVWGAGGAHFVAIDGYREFAETGEQWVHVQDPASGPNFYLYEDLVANYPPDGNWQDTYLVKRNGH